MLKLKNDLYIKEKLVCKNEGLSFIGLHGLAYFEQASS